jgi:hypothetical protein
MPLNGLTNRARTFGKIGQIRKGEKDESGKMHDLDYFRVTFRKGEEEAKKMFFIAYGERPQKLNIRLAFPEIERVWDANLECYSKGGMIAKAASTPERGWYWIFYRDHDSGEVYIRNGIAVNEEGSRLIEAGVDPEKPVYTYSVNRKQEDGSTKKVQVGAFLEPVGRLHVVIPEVAQVAVGYFEFRPTSLNDIGNISAELGGIEWLARQAGKTITGIPMILSRREDEISKNMQGKLSRGTSWLVHIDPQANWGDQALKFLTAQSYPDAIEAEVKQLPAGPTDDDWTDDEPPATEAPAVIIAPAPAMRTPDKAQDAQPEPALSAEKTEARKPYTRPYTPDELKERIRQAGEIAKEKKTEPKKDARLIINSILENALGPAEDWEARRRALLQYLTGHAGTAVFYDYEVVAMYTWMKPTKQTDGTYKADPVAVQEITEVANTISQAEAKK